MTSRPTQRPEAVLLFAVVCLWTPPHFWALAIRYRDDYRNAGVPMLPVVAGIGPTIDLIRKYAVATALVSLGLVLGNSVGLVYLLPAGALGAWFVLGALRLTEARSMAFFHQSITYLTLLFGLVALEAVWGSPI